MNTRGAQYDREMQLDILLRRIEGDKTGDRSTLEGKLDSDVAELLDMARRLRVASYLRALWPSASLASVARRTPECPRRTFGSARRRWAAAVAACLVVAAAGSLSLAFRPGPASPWYGMRVMIEELPAALAPVPQWKAELLVRAMQPRFDEIRQLAVTGDAGGLRRAADTLDAQAGWLHSISTLLQPSEKRRLGARIGAYL